ncbi:MAG: isoprenyl transferase [Clostridiales Family XIII bacterium]|jgi:undecaprenyl diphosphate synthase|nr:isoprenyl transferase [Clostridiales Family XIII bacterium]
MMDLDRIPDHIGIVMDGNGRWARAKGLPRLSGHNAGMLAMKEIVKRASALGVQYLTVYAFSTENWKRSVEEVSGIFNLLVLYVDRELAELNANNVKVRILGDYEELPRNAVERLRRSIETTADNSGMCFCIALNYGSRDEIARGLRAIAADALAGRLAPAEIDEALIAGRLYTAGMPDPDLIIRTGGERRLSNFLLWQSAYSELVFSEAYWPDFTPRAFEKAIEEYQGRERRFGGR